MARKKRSVAQREAHHKQIWIWYVQGMLQAEMAEKLGVSQQQVSYDIKALQKRWREESMQSISEAKAKELGKIDALEKVYWEAWLNSCQDAETKTQKIKVAGDDESGLKEQTRTLKGQSGNPAFLRGVEWCIQMRAKIMGVESAIKQFNFDVPLESLSVEQLTRLATGENPLNVLGNSTN